jgi:hypothetical protein
MLVLDAFDEMADRGFADMLIEIFKHVIPEEAENAEEGENGEEAARTAEEPALANGEPALADGEPALDRNGEPALDRNGEPALADGEPAVVEGLTPAVVEGLTPAVVEGLTPAVVLEAVALTESDTAARTARMQVVLFASSSGPLTHAARELARDITEKLSEPVRVIEIQNEPMRYSLGRVQQFYIAVSVN